MHITAGYTTDIETQSAGNYTYDEIGQLTSDALENINSIVWNVKGKARLIRKNAASKDETELGYDAMGHRIMKIVKPRDGSNALKGEKDWTYTFYTLDARGNVMATYERVIEETSPGSGSYNVKIKLKEQYIYGSQRIGQRSTSVEEKVISLGTLSTTIVAHFRDNTNETKINWASYTLTLPSNDDAHEESYNANIGATVHKVYTAKRKMGEKSYELSNHLGNVMEVISDRRKSADVNTYTSTGTLSSATADTKVDYYYADVLAYNDYSPFGALMPGRNGNTSSYRYGFNGKEKDDEIKGSGNNYDFGSRLYDDRIGRFLKVDSDAKVFTSLSPYCFAANNVTIAVDFDGRGPIITVQSKYLSGELKTAIEKYKAGDIDFVTLNAEIEKIVGSKYTTPQDASWLYDNYVRSGLGNPKAPKNYPKLYDASFDKREFPAYYVAYQNNGSNDDILHITLTEQDDKGNWTQNSYQVTAPEGTYKDNPKYMSTPEEVNCWSCTWSAPMFGESPSWAPFDEGSISIGFNLQISNFKFRFGFKITDNGASSLHPQGVFDIGFSDIPTDYNKFSLGAGIGVDLKFDNTKGNVKQYMGAKVGWWSFGLWGNENGGSGLSFGYGINAVDQDGLSDQSKDKKKLKIEGTTTKTQ